MNFLERALAAALKSVGTDVREAANEAQRKIVKFVDGVDKTIDELDEIANDKTRPDGASRNESKRK